MRRKLAVAVVLLAACGSKKNASTDTGSGSAVGSGSGSAAVVEKPVTCPPGNAVQDGACVPVITAEKIEVVTQQKSRIDELDALLDKASVMEDPLELVNALRSLDEWKTLRGKISALEYVDTAAVTLEAALKQLKELKIVVAAASGGLADIKTSLDQLMTSTGAARRLDEVRADVSAKLRATLEPLAAQVAATITTVITPLTSELGKVKDSVTVACATARLGGSDQLKALCEKAEPVLAAATTFIADLKDRPAKLYDEVSTKLEAELSTLVDDAAKKALDTTQAAVNDALKLPAGGGSAAGSGSGSGSAAP